jgi:hypothetical protein
MENSDIREATRLAISVILFFGGIGFALGLVVACAASWGNWKVAMNLTLLFASCGAYYGAIMGLDGSSEMTGVDSPVARTVLCGTLAGLIVFLLLSWIPQSNNIAWVGGAVAIGAILGWIGWSWARYINSFIDFVIRMLTWPWH